MANGALFLTYRVALFRLTYRVALFLTYRLANLQGRFIPNVQARFIPNLQGRFIPNVQARFIPNVQGRFIPNVQARCIPNYLNPWLTAQNMGEKRGKKLKIRNQTLAHCITIHTAYPLSHRDLLTERAFIVISTIIHMGGHVTCFRPVT